MIRRLFIANRGEIACRIMRTARRMGFATVAVYSDADCDAMHVALADAAVRIGPAPAAQSYLNIGAILDAARSAGADAIHPGYGFLSENAVFARACADAGLSFVGPSPMAIEAMGDKARARRIMAEAGVPVVPGYDGEDQSAKRLAEEAKRIGFPLLIKAVAGGGGRGMRRVDVSGDIETALDGARREAKSAFGDDRVLIERLVHPARHIEVQVLGDRHGNVIHLGERDCTTQRRHQKVIEEQPSVSVSEDLRKHLVEAAISAARAVDYVGAGTVEFVVGEGGSFHFLEMNTRLQVEHPVTEMVTGIDLVEWQLRIADGESLPAQEEIRFSGHAIEARLYAEDPATGFAPQAGRILHWRPDKAAGIEGIRVDTGVREGDIVSPFYDPMVAKLIAHGATRQEATARLATALRTTPMLGLRNNVGLLLGILGGETFGTGSMTTGTLDAEPMTSAKPDAAGFALAALALCLAPGGDWFRTSGVAEPAITLTCRDRSARVTLVLEHGRVTSAAVDGEQVDVGSPSVEHGEIRRTHGGSATSVPLALDGPRVWLFVDDEVQLFEEPDPLALGSAGAAGGRVVAPLAGVVSHVGVNIGDVVAAGQTVAVIEAMKMDIRLAASLAGRVTAVQVATGKQVRTGDVLVEIELDPA